MTAAAQEIVRAFDALSETEKREVTVELLRRSASTDSHEIPDETFTEMANELFIALDQEEDEHDRAKAR